MRHIQPIKKYCSFIVCCFTALILVSCGDTQKTGLIYLLVDRTGQWQANDQEKFSKTLGFFHNLVEQSKGGQHIVVASINDSTTRLRELVAMEKPGFGILENEKSPSAQKKIKEFSSALKQKLDGISTQLSAPESGVASPLMEALVTLIKQIKETKKYNHVQLVVFSDMVQNTVNINFWKLRTTSPNDFLVQAEKVGLIPDMSNIAVYVYGVGNFDFRDDIHKPSRIRKRVKSENDTFVRHNEELWRAYFKAAQAQLKAYAQFPL